VAEEKEQSVERKAVVGSTLVDVTDHINRKNNSAKKAQLESLDVFLALYFTERASDPAACTVEGMVTEITSDGVLAFVERYGFKARVRLAGRDSPGVALLPKGFFGESPPAEAVEEGTFEADANVCTLSPPAAGGAGGRWEGRGAVELRRFDHVRLLVTVSHNAYRVGRLELHLLGKLGGRAKRNGGGGKGGDAAKSAVVQSVVEARLKPAVVGLEALAAGTVGLPAAPVPAAVYTVLETFKQKTLLRA
jgi:hypothetical protein